jgi:selenocysteine lyase/cysteine desulfurase
MAAIREYEAKLSLELLLMLRECGASVYGIAEQERIAERVPTFCFNLPGVAPAAVTEALSRAGVGVRDGHMYSPRLMKRLGLSEETGAVRVSLVHYNTIEEIHRFGTVLLELSKHA